MQINQDIGSMPVKQEHTLMYMCIKSIASSQSTCFRINMSPSDAFRDAQHQHVRARLVLCSTYE